MEADGLNKEKYLTAAYEDFKSRLCYKYLVTFDSSDFQQLKKVLDMKSGNSNPTSNYLTCMMPCCWLNLIFEVPQNHFALVINEFDGGKRTVIYGPGYHIINYFNSLQGIYSFHTNYRNNMIESSIGDLKIVRVNQGYIMNFDCSGQNVILPPGIHKITDPMIFVSIISLDQFYI